MGVVITEFWLGWYKCVIYMGAQTLIILGSYEYCKYLLEKEASMSNAESYAVKVSAGAEFLIAHCSLCYLQVWFSVMVSNGYHVEPP